MPSAAPVAAVPAPGAAACRLAALRAGIARLEALFPVRPPAAPRPAPCTAGAVAATAALARAQSALFEARAARYALRDEPGPRPGRFARLRAAIIRCREAQAAYAAAAAAYHASPAGAALQDIRARYPLF
ncbi:hypothetical protein [uncultured Hymenobacter sp.]|uniref:hypothetical protein n=1 Tax=uncultured Hymenobacter sp. TaxID=170016 RepID=UPI0035C9D395